MVPVNWNSAEKRLKVLSVLYLPCIYSNVGAFPIYFIKLNLPFLVSEYKGMKIMLNSTEKNCICCKFYSYLQITVVEGTVIHLRHYFNIETGQDNNVHVYIL